MDHFRRIVVIRVTLDCELEHMRTDIALAATAGDRRRAAEFLDLGEKAFLEKARRALTQR